MTAAPTHSSISLEARQGNPAVVSTAPVVLRRSERLVNKPKVDYRQVALQPRWPMPTAARSKPCPVPTLYPSSSFAALQQHVNPSAFETLPATLVERGRNVTNSLLLRRRKGVSKYFPRFSGAEEVSDKYIYRNISPAPGKKLNTLFWR